MQHPSDLHSYAETYLKEIHGSGCRFPGTTKIRYITQGYRWDRQIVYTVQYLLADEAKCSIELRFDDDGRELISRSLRAS